MRWLFCLMISALPSVAFAEEVTMYGAVWCGPCGAVKAYLSANRVAFEYVDIDTDAGRARYERARGDFRGIPLTTIGSQQVRGANLIALGAALQQAKVMAKEAAAPAGESYGGHSPSWWQAQFRQLRMQLARMDQEIASNKKTSIDHYEKELLAKLETDREIVAQSIDQLENDASNVSLPRKYRE